MIEKIKKYYDDGLWNIERIKVLVQKTILTEEDYKMIVGYEYKE